MGISTFLTVATDEIQQLSSAPFGETMAGQHSQTEDYETPYKFNGKEMGSETGLYYYGIRYYDPKTSIFLSADPLMEMYANVNPYAYCLQSVEPPIDYVDERGNFFSEQMTVVMTLL